MKKPSSQLEKRAIKLSNDKVNAEFAFDIDMWDTTREDLGNLIPPAVQGICYVSTGNVANIIRDNCKFYKKEQILEQLLPEETTITELLANLDEFLGRDVLLELILQDL